MERIRKSAEIGVWPTTWARTEAGVLTLGTTTANWVSGGVIPLPQEAAYMTVNVAIDGVTSESNAQVAIGLMLSPWLYQPAGASSPSAINDIWFQPTKDGSASTGTPAALPASQVITKTPAQATLAVNRNYWLGPVLSAATDKVRQTLQEKPIDVRGFRWVQFFACEVGDTSHCSKVAISIVTSSF